MDDMVNKLKKFVNSDIFCLENHASGKKGNIGQEKKWILVRSKEKRIKEKKICLPGNNEEKFSLAHKIRCLILDVAMKLPTETVRKLEKSRKKRAVCYGRSPSEQSVPS